MTDISAGKFNFICRLCTSSLVNGGYEIFEDNDDEPKQILKKIAKCLPIKVLFILSFSSIMTWHFDTSVISVTSITTCLLISTFNESIPIVRSSMTYAVQ